MSRFEDWAKYNNIQKIKFFIKFLGYKQVNYSSSQEEIYENNRNIIIIKEKDNK